MQNCLILVLIGLPACGKSEFSKRIVNELNEEIDIKNICFDKIYNSLGGKEGKEFDKYLWQKSREIAIKNIEKIVSECKEISTKR